MVNSGNTLSDGDEMGLLAAAVNQQEKKKKKSSKVLKKKIELQKAKEKNSNYVNHTAGKLIRRNFKNNEIS